VDQIVERLPTGKLLALPLNDERQAKSAIGILRVWVFKVVVEVVVVVVVKFTAGGKRSRSLRDRMDDGLVADLEIGGDGEA